MTTTTQTAKSAERDQQANRPDPFPPEGTDEKVLKPGLGEKPLGDAETLKATRAALDAGNTETATSASLIDTDDDQPDDPAEGRRDDEPEVVNKVPSTHVPGNRIYDL